MSRMPASISRMAPLAHAHGPFGALKVFSLSQILLIAGSPSQSDQRLQPVSRDREGLSSMAGNFVRNILPQIAHRSANEPRDRGQLKINFTDSLR
jgi:hypothetical protein